jgi:hypothetical protein
MKCFCAAESRATAAAVVSLMTATSMVGCADESCLDPLRTDCQPLYEPTFTNIYDNTLSKSCAVGNGTCHTVDGQGVANNLSFATEDSAYAGLTGMVDGVKRAIENDAECSILIQRLESDDPDIQMPPGKKLQESERCAIIQWVAAGTPR